MFRLFPLTSIVFIKVKIEEYIELRASGASEHTNEVGSR